MKESKWDIAILPIFKAAFKSIGSANGLALDIYGVVIYVLIPSCFTFFLLYFHISFDMTAISIIVTALSIIVGLLLNFIVLSVDKAKERNIIIEREKEKEINVDHLNRYSERYKEFVKDLLAQVTFSIVLSIFLIGFLFLTQIKTSICLIHYITNGVSYFGLGLLMVFLLSIVTRMFSVLNDELN